jgi:hypothetical protein
MTVEKQAIIQRLFEKEMITLEEVMILSATEKEFIPVPYQVPQQPVFPQPQQPIYPQPYTPPSYPPQYPPSYPNPMDQWAQDEMKRRAEIADRCPCNPKNGGSGICGCTLTGPVIYCSANPVGSVTMSNATFVNKSSVNAVTN